MTTREGVVVVVASRASDNTSWLEDNLPDYDIVKYVTDEVLEDAESVPINKGHEAMVYLTYIIDNYYSLPEVVVFSHAQRYQWHNDDPLYDGARMLAHLQIPYVQENGYANLRCAWKYGCPAEIRPLEHGDEPAPTDPVDYIMKDVKPFFYKRTFQTLFPGEKVPELVAAGCCAQFAVAADTVRRRSAADYVRARQWLITTPLPDNVSGRLMEYLWHILFGQPPVTCPVAEECYCKVYGKCELDCREDGCDGQYVFPEGERLPAGWPELGFDGKPQDVPRLRKEQERDYTT